MVGDGESAEGSIWEALNFASFYNLDNLVVIFDVNRLGQSGPTSLNHDMEIYRQRCQSFGLNSIVVDGHDVEELTKVNFYLVTINNSVDVFFRFRLSMKLQLQKVNPQLFWPKHSKEKVSPTSKIWKNGTVLH